MVPVGSLFKKKIYRESKPRSKLFKAGNNENFVCINGLLGLWKLMGLCKLRVETIK
jgi:hypothetical protein